MEPVLPVLFCVHDEGRIVCEQRALLPPRKMQRYRAETEDERTTPGVGTKDCLVYEVKLIEVLGAVIASAIPFVTAALKNRFGIGLVGTLVTVVCMRIGGLWLAVPSCIGFTVVILFFLPRGRDESVRGSVTDKDEE